MRLFGVFRWMVFDKRRYLIRYGGVTSTAPDGSVTRMGAGFGLGLFHAMAGVPRSETTVADTDLVALRWETATFYAVLENDPALTLRLLAMISSRLSDLNDAHFAVPSGRETAQEHP